jgi:hypothetical protein
MAKFQANIIKLWTEEAAAWLEYRGLDLAAIMTGRDAWAVAHAVGITREAYNDRSVTDGHIQTALAQIFPNAVFKDRKIY